MGIDKSMITLLLVDDQPSVRTALRSCLSLEPDLQIVGEADGGTAALAQAQALRPDVMLADVKMPDMDGIAATEALRQLAPGTQVVILTLYDDRDTRAKAHAAGAAAFVAKHEPLESLLTVIRQVAGKKH